MADKDNVAIARRGFDAWNAHDVEGWIKTLDPNQVAESDTIPGSIKGHDGARAFMQIYLKAFPDLRFTVDQMIGHDQYVVTRYTASGTHKNGKIVHQWIYWDTGHLLRQLGVLPGA